MANRNGPHGLIPRYHENGGEIRTEPVTLKSTNAIIGVGDPLVQAVAGVYDRWASGRIDAVAAQRSAASSGAVIEAYRDPGIVFSAQCDGTTGTLTAAANMSLNATVVAADASNGMSQFTIDESSGDTTATLPLKIRGLFPSPANAYGQYNELYCTLNNTADKGGTGTVGLASA